MLENIENSISKKMSENYDYNQGSNIEYTIPVESKILSWILFILPLIILLLYKPIIWLHKKIIRMLYAFSRIVVIINRSLKKSNKFDNSKVFRKYFLHFVLFIDVLFIGFCFAIHTVPITHPSYHTPDFKTLASYYGDSEHTSINLMNESLFFECCYSNDDFEKEKENTYFQNTTLPTIISWWNQTVTLEERQSSSSSSSSSLSLNTDYLESIELIKTYRLLSILINLEESLGVMLKKIIADNNYSAKETYDLLLRIPEIDRHHSLVGFWSKRIKRSYHNDDDDDDKVYKKFTIDRKICCVCYDFPVTTKGLQTESLVVYGLLLLCGLIARLRIRMKTLFTFSCLTFCVVIVIFLQDLFLTKRDIYGSLVPSRDMHHLLHKCVEIYSVIQTNYTVYYVLIAHAGMKSFLIYLFLLITKIIKVDAFT